jgi:hypothetical protein
VGGFALRVCPPWTLGGIQELLDLLESRPRRPFSSTFAPAPCGLAPGIPPPWRLSKHTPPPNSSSIWGRKKSSIWSMCSGPPRYYNPINRQAGRPSSPSEERRPGFSVRIGPVLRRGALLMYKLGDSHEFRKHKKPITFFGAQPHPVGGPDPIGSVRIGLSRSSMLGVLRSVRHESAPEVLSLLL